MDEAIIKFTRGVPPPESFPKKQLMDCVSTVYEEQSDIILQYGSSGGYPPLREWIAECYRVSPGRVILGQGSLQLFDILSRILVFPGDVVYTEDPTYDRAATILRRSGGRVVGFPITLFGPDLDLMEDHLNKGERPKLIYTIPDFQNPSGMVIPFESRKRMIELADKYNFWIVEDSPYRSLRYSGTEIPSLFEINPEHVIPMSSFSKLISPGLRVGFIVLPEILSSQVLKFAEDTYINSSYINQATIMEFIRRGELSSNLEVLKTLYRPRLETILDSLNQQMASLGSWSKPEGGFFVGFSANFPLDMDLLLGMAKAKGLQLTDGRGFFVTGNGSQFIRLPFCALTPQEIKKGIDRLSAVLKMLQNEPQPMENKI